VPSADQRGLWAAAVLYSGALVQFGRKSPFYWAGTMLPDPGLPRAFRTGNIPRWLDMRQAGALP